ncbi:MAG: AraC family transcriptional regulator [Paenibacillus sp.]|nr:AraC family transcriptional regulator [Paenibacillus sp.]
MIKVFHLQPIMSTAKPFEYSALFNELYQTWSSKRLGYLIKCRGLLMQILYLLIREDNYSASHIPYYTTIEKLLTMIAANCEKSYTSEQFADMAGISPSYMRILFKKMTGVNPSELMNK